MGKKIQFAKRPQASSRESMNGRSLSVTGKKSPREKKNRDAFSPPPGQIALVCDTPPWHTRLWTRACPLLFRRREYSFQNDYRLSYPHFFPRRRREAGGPASLSRSPWEIIRANPPLRTGREEDLSSSINKHNCPRSWRGRNSSWINLRATAASPPAPIVPSPSTLSLEGPAVPRPRHLAALVLCWFYFPSFANSGIRGVIARYYYPPRVGRARMRPIENWRREPKWREFYGSPVRSFWPFTIVLILTSSAYILVDVIVAMPDVVDDSFVWLPNGLTVPFELRREVVSVKLPLQLQHRLSSRQFSSRLSVWPLVDFTSPSSPTILPASAVCLIPTGYAY